jgi:hypothetical protein
MASSLWASADARFEMSLLFFDGFESIGADNTDPTDAVVSRRWSTSAPESFYMVDGRFGGTALRFANAADYFVISSGHGGVNSTDTTKIWGLSVLFPASITYATSYWFMRFATDTSQWAAGLRIWNDGTISLEDKGDAIQAISTKGALRLGIWNDIQVKLYYHTSNGSCQIKVGGNVVLNKTGVDTGGTSGNYHDRVFVYSPTGTTGYAPRFDDIFVLDTTGNTNNDFLPSSRVTAQFPTSDITTNWTPSTGNDHYALVDETLPDDNTSYITGNSANDIDQFEVTDISANALTIHGVKLSIDSSVNEAGSREIRQVLDSSGNNYAGDTHTINTTNYVFDSDYWETDPATSNAWTVNNYNASKPGVEVVT